MIANLNGVDDGFEFEIKVDKNVIHQQGGDADNLMKFDEVDGFPCSLETGRCANICLDMIVIIMKFERELGGEHAVQIRNQVWIHVFFSVEFRDVFPFEGKTNRKVWKSAYRRTILPL